MRILAVAAGLVAVALAVQPAFGAPGGGVKPGSAKDAEREVARGFAERAVDLFQQGDYQRAMDLFFEAEKHFHAPHHVLFIARAQDKLGLLLDASATYKRLVDEKLPDDAPGPFKEAQATGKAELAALDARIPTLAVGVTGSASALAHVSIDGGDIEQSAWGEPKKLDPGTHTVDARAPEVPSVRRSVTLKEGAHERLDLVLEPPPKPSLAPQLIAFGAGALGLGVGAITGAMSLGVVGDLDSRCPSRHCTPNDEADGSRAKTLGTVSTIGFIVGAAGVAAGVVIVVTRPRRAPVAMAVGPLALTVRGAF